MTVAWIYIALVGVLFPYSSVKRFFRPPDPTKTPESSRSKLVIITVATLAVMGVFAIACARAYEIDLFAPWHFNALAVMAGVLTLTANLSLRSVLLKWLRADPRRNPSRIIPKTWAEFPSWALISASAGLWEEVIYRGTLYKFIAYFANSFVVAFIATSLVFAAMHLYQGVRGFLFILFLGMCIQWVVNFSGTLYIAIAVHFAYDLIVGVLMILEEQKKREKVPITL